MDRLKKCFDLIGEYGTQYLPSDPTTKSEIPLVLSARHGMNALDALARLLPHENLLSFAATISRSFYENSVRLLWATLEKDGWDRLDRWWNGQLLKFNKECLEANPDSSQYRENIAAAQECLKQLEHVKEPPQTKQMIRQIYKYLDHDGIEALDVDRTASYYYAFLYQYHSMHVHNQPSAMLPPSNPESVSRAVTLTAITATRLLLRAICRRFLDESSPGSHEVDDKIVAIMEKW